MRHYLIPMIIVHVCVFPMTGMVQEIVDSDQDGLPDEKELELGTDPTNPDTDGDGLNDGFEIESNYNGNPRRKPTDYTNPWTTDPTKSDTDGDGLSDGWEIGEERYIYVEKSLSWEEANIEAQKFQFGHLATITSKREDFVYQNLLKRLLRNAVSNEERFRSPLLGGKENESDVWEWITGEKWTFNNWAPGEPNDYEGKEPYLSSGYWGDQYNRFYWNDLRNDLSSYSNSDERFERLGSYGNPYLVEIGYPSDPTNPDTDGDGYDDFQENEANTDPNDPHKFPAIQLSDTWITDRLVAHYTFNGNAEDSSPNENHITGAGVFSNDKFGNEQSCLELLTEVATDLESVRALGFEDNVTVSVWVQPKEFDLHENGHFKKYTIFGIGNSYDSTWNSHFVRQGPGFVSLNIEGFENNTYLGGGGIWSFFDENSAVDQWHHLVFAISENNELDIYLNGFKRETVKLAAEFKIADGPLKIGSFIDESFVGKMDELRIYNRTLNQEEIIRLHTLEKNFDSSGQTMQIPLDSEDKPKWIEEKEVLWLPLDPEPEENGPIKFPIITQNISLAEDRYGFENRSVEFSEANDSVIVISQRNQQGTSLPYGKQPRSFSFWYKLAHPLPEEPYRQITLLATGGAKPEEPHDGGDVFGVFLTWGGAKHLRSFMLDFRSPVTGRGSYYNIFDESFFSDTWNHLAVTMENGDPRAYLNGEIVSLSANQPIGSPETVIDTEQNDYFLGGGYDYGNNAPLSGQIDDLRVFKTALSAQEISELYEYESRLPPVETWIEDGLVGYYPFNGDSNDESGNDHHLINYGAELTVDRHGRANSAYDFNKEVLAGMRGDNVDGLPFYQNDKTITFWALPHHDFSHQYQHWPLVSFSSFETPDYAGGSLMFFTFSHGGITLEGGGGAYNSYVNYKGNVDTSFLHQWHHYAFSYSKNAWKMYLDGETIQWDGLPPENFVWDTKQSDLFIGTFRDKYFDGLLDDIRIYDRALSGDQIRSVFLSEANLDDYDDDGLSDGYETYLGTSLTNVDTDNDGVLDSHEVFLGADPLSKDSDDDVLEDLQELSSGSDPLDPDSDGDGITDHKEIFGTDGIKTNPVAWDSDGDGFSDLSELNLNTDPSDALNFPEVLIEPTWFQNGLVSYFSFDGDFLDYGSGNNNLTSLNVEFSEDRFGKDFHAAFFDSSKKARLTSEPVTTLPIGQAARTISFWLKPAWNPDENWRQIYILSFDAPRTSDHNGGNFPVSTSSSGELRIDGSYGAYGKVSGVYNDRKWIHLVLRLKDNHLDGFIDGMPVDWDWYPPLGYEWNTQGNELFVGAFRNNYFDGQLDDIRIYDRALSKSEVRELYEYERVPDTAIEEHPSDQVMTFGDSTILTVVAKNASSAVELGYQWFRNEEAIEGATDAQLRLENVNNTDAGTYHVVVSGGFEPVSSNPFLLDVVKHSQTIQWNVVSEAVLDGDVVRVQTEASSGLPVAVEVVDGAALLVGEALKPLGGGTVRLKASQEGNETYDPAPDVFHSIEVLLRPEITHSDGGSVVNVPALDVFTLGQDLSLRAIPDDGFAFAGWQGDIESTNNPFTVSVSGNLSLQAVFKPLWPLFLESVDGGRIMANPEQEQFIEGSRVSLLGVADEGYRFDRWLGSVSGNESATMLIMDGAKSVSAVFVEHRAPIVATELSVSRIKVGDAVTIEVNAIGTAPLSFQWLKNGEALPGASTASLTLSEAQSEDSGIYSVVVSNAAGESTKEVLDLGVLKPLVLISQRNVVEQMARTALVLDVVVEGDGPLAYEWSKDGVSLGLVTEAGLVFESLKETDSGVYTLSITSAVSTVTSEPITVKVTPFVEPPVFTQELNPQAVAVGASLFLTVANSGEPPFDFIWSKDGEEVATTNDPFLLLSSVQEAQGGLYSVKVSNPGGEASSGPAEIRVLPPAVITTQPIGVQVMQTLPFSLGVVVEGGGDVGYQWFKDGAEITGATGDTLSVDESDFAQTGQYKVVVETEIGSIESETVSVLVTPLVFAPEIIAGPESQKVHLGDSVSLTVVVGGTKPFEFTWFHNGEHVDGETEPFLIIESVTEEDLGSYTVEVKNDQGSVLFNDEAILSLRQSVAITGEPEDQRVVLGEELRLDVQLEGDPPFTVHWEKDGEIVPEETDASLVITSISEDESGTYQLVITERGLEIRSRLIDVVVLVPPSISSQPKDQELVAGQRLELTVEASGTAPMTFQLLRDGSVIQENQSGVFAFESVSNDVVGLLSVTVSNETGTVSSETFTLTLTTAPPVIVSQSSSMVVTPGDRLELFVEATGGSIGYRWFKDGALIEGATEAQLLIDPVTSQSAGEYFAVLTNSRGVITSTSITVSLSARLKIVNDNGELRLEIVGESGGEVWRVERSSDLVTWELVENVVLEMEAGFAFGALKLDGADDVGGFFRATR